MNINIVVAMDLNGVIGKGNELPWHLPEDLRRFRALTLGKTIVMGRKTYYSILKKNGRPLDERNHTVLSRKKRKTSSVSAFHRYGVRFIDDVELILKHAEHRNEDLYVIGGEQIYKLFLPLADNIYLTRVHAEFDGDKFFPEVDPSEWREVSREIYRADEKNPYDMTFHLYRREK